MGAPRKRVPKCLKGPKTTYTTIANAEKQSKRSKKGPFSLYTESPLVPPRKPNLWARRGRSLPVPPGFSGHAGSLYLHLCQYFVHHCAPPGFRLSRPLQPDPTRASDTHPAGLSAFCGVLRCGVFCSGGRKCGSRFNRS